MTELSGQEPGGAGGVVTVNGIPAVDGDVSLTATDIPTTSGNVQGELDALNSAVTLSTVKVESWADFAAAATFSPPNTWTWNFEIVGSGQIGMPFGANIVGGTSCKMSGASTSESLVWVANVDGPAFSGPLSVARMTIVQLHPGANARCIDVTSDGTRSPLVNEVALVNGRVGLRVGAVTGPLKVQSVISVNADVGFEVGAFTVDSIAFVGCNAFSFVPGFVAAKIDAGATVTGGVLFAFPAWTLATGQFGFAAADAATFVSPALFQLAGAANSGPQAAMFRQDVGDMSTADVRLVNKGSPSSADWAATGIGSRTDRALPIVVEFDNPDEDTLIPYEDPGGTSQFVATTDIRFDLFLDPGDPENWYWEYLGPIEDVTASVVLEILHSRPSGTGAALLKWQCNEFPAYAGFTDVPNSTSEFTNTNLPLSHGAAATAPNLNAGDRLRLVAQNNADVFDLRLQKLKMDLSIT